MHAVYHNEQIVFKGTEDECVKWIHKNVTIQNRMGYLFYTYEDVAFNTGPSYIIK